MGMGWAFARRPGPSYPTKKDARGAPFHPSPSTFALQTFPFPQEPFHDLPRFILLSLSPFHLGGFVFLIRGLR